MFAATNLGHFPRVAMLDHAAVVLAAVELVIFHYHLEPGGVTDVVVESVRALLAGRDDLPDLAAIERITIVAGRGSNVDAIRDRLGAARRSGAGVAIDVLPELDYATCPDDRVHAEASARALSTTLRNTYGGKLRLWWVHNYHLGKNVAFTTAIIDIARSGQPMLLQIHDFPECGRYENLACLHRVVGQPLYPLTPTTHYGLINSRDHELLAAGGIGEGRVHLLLNPVKTPPRHTAERNEPLDAEDRRALRRELITRAPHALAGLDPEKPMLLYPVRAIRRKNVLELALLSRLRGDLSLVVTLPGTSASERVYSDLVAHAFADHSAPGACYPGAKSDQISFPDLIDASDLVGSSSVQEGFGFTYVGSMSWRRPLLARYLDVLDGVRGVFDGYPHHFYDRVRIPFSSPSLTDFRGYLRMRYAERIDELESILPEHAIDQLHNDLDSLLAADSVCYSFLSPNMQYTILCDLAEPTFLSLVSSLNRSLLDSIGGLLGAECPDSDERIEATFGYSAFAHSAAEALGAITRERDAARKPDADAGEDSATVHRSIVDRFAHLDYLRLLYAPMEREMHG